VIPVLVDCDPGQDDALALLLALASPELDVLGVTTVAGNQTVDKTTANALRVLELAGRTDIRVAAGAERPLVGELVVAADAHGESGLDGPALPPAGTGPVEAEAADFLAHHLLEAAQPVTLIPLGPLTNVARLLGEHPEAAARIERIVLMGGAVREGNQTPSAEFNIWIDPEAAALVFDSGLDVTMVGLDVTNDAVLTNADADRLRGSGPVGAAAAAMLDFYLGFYNEAYEHGGAPIHDAVAVAHVFRPDLLTLADKHVEVDTSDGICRGRTVVDMRKRRRGPTPNAHVALDIDSEGFRSLLVERLRTFSPTSPGTARLTSQEEMGPVDKGPGMSYKRPSGETQGPTLAEGERP
jgi:inosine-uridine nucleoside N-ribohydrolase